tara:strand:+ start:1064 stop:1885 length:822 start_codon:yes stop_codon:yes gene_type:complete
MIHKNLCWWGDNGNWGDQLNPKLFSFISGVPTDEINRIWLGDEFSTPRYYCIGSILNLGFSSNYEVWGSGMEDSNHGVKFHPSKIHAVRGPLTRKGYIKWGVNCPEIYGDPALLYPRFYKPDVKKEYKYGIIPHFYHKNHSWVTRFKDDPQINIIDVQDPIVNNFVDEINKCEIILSSALHGIICADSYGIPSYFIDLTDKETPVNYFKLNDYLMSVKRPLVEAYRVQDITNLDDFYYYNYSIDIDLDKLLEVCPFKNYYKYIALKNEENKKY